jgi:hypothetical protein
MYWSSSGIAVHRLSPFATRRVVYCESRTSLVSRPGRWTRKRMRFPVSFFSVRVLTVFEVAPSRR